jgi:predicted aspartyl protease
LTRVLRLGLAIGYLVDGIGRGAPHASAPLALRVAENCLADRLEFRERSRFRGRVDHATLVVVRSVATASRGLRGLPSSWLLVGFLAPAALSFAGPANDAFEVAVPAVAIGSEPADIARGGVVPSLFATPTTRDHIGRVVVPVMVNGQGPFRFIVDTGANRSTISPQLVRTLGLTPVVGSTVVVNGITGAAQTVYVMVDSLQAGDLLIDGTALPVVWAPVMAGADGILGAAGLSEKSLLIDFQRNRVEIARHVDSLLRGQSVRIHGLSLTHGLVAVEARVGRTRVTAIIDTGAERTLGNVALRNALKLPRARGVVMLTSVYGATKEIELGEIARAPPITIDSLHITDVAIVYGDFHIFGVWGLQATPALVIGMDVLGTVASLSIDYKNKEIYVASVRDGRGLPNVNGGSLTDNIQRK